ncbi:hypothetical protein [Roseateles sp. UC29_93]|uniref:hypothetical protein n=1 Tax=Roseateles TaxID=93681 RepID=UPI0036706B3F
MEIAIFQALKGAGVSEADARSAAEAIQQGVRSEVRDATKDMATKTDLADLRGDLIQRISDLQRFVVASVFGSSGMLAVMITVFNYLR